MNQPMRRRFPPGSLSEIDTANRRDDQITEDEQDICNPDEARHDQTKNGIEEKIPPAHPETLLISAIAVE